MATKTKYFDYLDNYSLHLEKFIEISDLEGKIKFYRQNYTTHPANISIGVRAITEQLAKAYEKKHHLGLRRLDLKDLIHALYLKRVISEQDKQLFNEIRLIGNKGAHGEPVTSSEAEQCLINLDKLLRSAIYTIAGRPLKGYPKIEDDMKLQQEKLYQTFDRKLIYIQSGTEARYDGLEKIGDASVPDDLEADFTPNSEYLRQYASKRINQYMRTAGVPYELHWAQLAVNNKKEFFRDYDVHNVLKRSGYKAVPLGADEKGRATEWFEVSVDTAKEAIKAVKEGRSTIEFSSQQQDEPKIVLRSEQLAAIKQTLNVFKKKKEMLWNAKMRFGKTLSALQLIKQGKYKKVLIMTHRPVVSDGWFNDYPLIFTAKDNYTYGSKNDGTKIEELVGREDPFIYFASIQDLRGSLWAGGAHDKNIEFLKIPWDLIIIDEAHEGNETQLANNVKEKLKNDETRVLELSGTPFNLFDKYDEDNVFTWDYTMEQEAKYNWEKDHPNEPNPYEEIPKVTMYTFDISKSFNYVDETKSFNFKEFFRSENGELVHKEDVVSFLNQITTEDETTNYPYSTEEYRHQLRHTLWLLPGVAEANALEKVLKEHPVFKEYTIVNVVSRGDNDIASDEELEMVRSAIGEHPGRTKTITLTVRKLTTGVNVKQWTGVFFLNNTESPTTYLQAAFRAQTPFNNEEMGIKKNCYVFDFAPDRALKIMSESIGLTSKKGKINTTEQKEKMAKLLNFFPIIGQSGNAMVEFSVDRMLTQLKKAFAEKAVRSGFEDTSLYNDNLLGLDEVDLADFSDLKAIVGTSQATKNDMVIIAENGFTEEERERAEKAERKKKKERTKEEQEAIEQLQKLRKQKAAMISILRGVSIRIPMMIYGMRVDLEEDISISKFIKLVDDQSWEEFMPNGLTKAMFKKFTRYYDNEVFIEAGRIIRQKAKSYDKLDVIERTGKIAELFGTFKNPDKETVLTPWRVVNLQLISTLGGLSYYDDHFEYTTIDGKSALHWVEKDETNSVYKSDVHVLDINSKTGLYPLFMATSLYYQLMQEENERNAGKFDALAIWKKVLKENIYAIAKTPMAKTITERTLAGYQSYQVNVEYIFNLTDLMKNDTEVVTQIIKERFNTMKFDYVIGNPPYQEKTIGDNTSFSPPIYHKFMDESYNLSKKVCLITPARFLFNAGSTPKDWNRKMLSDEHLQVIKYEKDSSKIFPSTDIKGGVVITYRDETKEFGAIGIFTPYPELNSILKKVESIMDESLSIMISGRGVYKLSQNALDEYPQIESIQSKGHKKDIGSSAFKILDDIIFFEEDSNQSDDYVKFLGLLNSKRVYRWADKKYIDAPESFNKYKVFIPQANGNGQFGEVISSPLVGGPNEGATETFLSIGGFETEFEAQSALKYIKTKFARTMLGVLKSTQANTRDKWLKVPKENFGKDSDIDWTKTISQIDRDLYKKYGLNSDEISFIEKNVKEMV